MVCICVFLSMCVCVRVFLRSVARTYQRRPPVALNRASQKYENWPASDSHLAISHLTLYRPNPAQTRVQNACLHWILRDLTGETKIAIRADSRQEGGVFYWQIGMSRQLFCDAHSGLYSLHNDRQPQENHFTPAQECHRLFVFILMNTSHHAPPSSPRGGRESVFLLLFFFFFFCCVAYLRNTTLLSAVGSPRKDQN